MLPIVTAALLATGAILGFFGMRALFADCLSSQRKRLREETEIRPNRPLSHDEAAALLLPIRVM